MKKTGEDLIDILVEGDIVEFKTGQVALHLSKIAGCCTSINEADYPKEKYVGQITDVHDMMKTPLRTKTYTIKTLKPLEGFFCSAIFPDGIIRIVSKNGK